MVKVCFSYKETLQYIPKQKQKRKRQRKIIWFNPPFNKNVETDIGRKFIQIIDRNFPREHKLSKIFNRNTLKISYSTTENMAQIINKHNKKILSKGTGEKNGGCNCVDKTKCPLDGKNCLTKQVVYKGETSSTLEASKCYIGITEGTWKGRHSVHKTSFKNREYKARTVLTEYIWKIKDQKKEMPQIKWTIEKIAPAYTNTSKRCLLCLEEKMAIIEYPDQNNLLNKRSELINKCRHQNKFLLKNYKSRSKNDVNTLNETNTL